MSSPFLALIALLASAVAVNASVGDGPADEAPADTSLASGSSEAEVVVVTATRTPERVFEVPAPVSVIGRRTLDASGANTIADIFPSLPGLEVSGVGVAQTRPGIRGQRGQRILLLEDGIRLNNSRRQSDFGEIPALADISSLDRVEIVRGPASVLYGSDAIGGVVNLITPAPPGEGVQGTLAYHYGEATSQNRGYLRLAGRRDRLAFVASGSLREAESYEAPAGTFGDITLDRDARVNDTGASDESLDIRLFYDVAEDHVLSGRFQIYRSDTTGFGYVDPAEYAPNLPLIEIRYPYQRFNKYTLGYEAKSLDFVAADRVETTVYAQENERRFDLDVLVTVPGFQQRVETENFTDLETLGFRAEAQKRIGSRHAVTYGVDLYRDRAEGTDRSTVTTVAGPPPPMVETSEVPLVPNATLRNVGLFVQDDVEVTRRLNVVAGARYQDVRAETEETEGIDEPLVDATDRTLVGALNASYALTPELRVIGAVGRGFRSPNLVERFFNGPTPEGAGFQARNTELDAETSLNLDLGVRLQRGAVSAEAFVFRNEITDGIRVAATGDTINSMPVFQNVNVDELRFTGVELSAEVRLPHGFEVAGNMSALTSEDVDEPELPVGDSASFRVNGWLRYRIPSRSAFVEYHVRHDGARDEEGIGGGPIGDELPGFTLHAIRAGAELFRVGRVSQELAVRVENLTDELYAELPNASFFRPEPGRRVVLTWRTRF